MRKKESCIEKRLIFIFLPFIFCFLSSLPIGAAIEKVDSLKHLKEKIDLLLTTYSPQDVLGLWEVDQVIFHRLHPAFDIRNIQKHGRKLKEKMKPLPQNKRDQALALVDLENEPVIADPHVPNLIRAYQNRGLRMIALMSTVVGRIGKHDKSEAVHYDYLRKNGIDFSQAFPDIREQRIEEQRLKWASPSIYYKGLLCAGAYGAMVVKGATLVSFLKAHDLHPKSIFMIDPKYMNLKDVEEALKQYDPSISFKGFEFKAPLMEPHIEISEKDFLEKWELYLSGAIIE